MSAGRKRAGALAILCLILALTACAKVPVPETSQKASALPSQTTESGTTRPSKSDGTKATRPPKEAPSDDGWQTLEPLVIRAAARAHDRKMQDGRAFAGTPAQALTLRARTLLAAREEQLTRWPNEDGSWTVLLKLAMEDGWEEAACRIDPAETAVPLSAKYEFVTAAVEENGTVTVRFDRDGAQFRGEDYQKIYQFELETDYEISGCFGQYTDLFLGNIGVDLEPYLFLRTADGTLEYVDLFRCALYGTFVSGGPVYGVRNVTDLYEKSVQMEGYGYTTVCARDASGQEWDLFEQVAASDQAPEALSALFRDGEDPDTWLRLFGESGAEARADGRHFTGFPLRLGSNEDGMLYALEFWDDTGAETSGVYALVPENNRLSVTLLSGESPFGLTIGQCRHLVAQDE